MIIESKEKTYRVHRGKGNESLKIKRKDTVRYGTLHKGKSGKVQRMKWKEQLNMEHQERKER